jgi:hypothetical protein
MAFGERLSLATASRAASFTGIEPMLPRFLLMAAFDPFLALTTSDIAALKSPLANAAASEGSVVLLAEERAANRRI